MFVLLILFAILNVADTITALFVLPGEGNPIYLLTHNIYIVILLKVLMIVILCFYYKRNIFPSHTWYYNTILVLLFANLLLGMAIYSNVQGMILMHEHPEIIDALNAIPDDVKLELFTKDYINFVSVFYFFPVGFSVLAFSLYRWSLRRIKIDKQFYKNLKWWQP